MQWHYAKATSIQERIPYESPPCVNVYSLATMENPSEKRTMASPCPPRLSLETMPVPASGADASDFRMDYAFVQTPLGRCLMAQTGGRIGYLAFAPVGSEREMLADLAARWPGAALTMNRQSIEPTIPGLFTPAATADTEIRLLVRGTDFQLEVWRALLCIPAGRVCSYAELARRVGRPRAPRAVGSAIGANPIAWLIPCHRVVRSDGQLGGYRWGIAMKKICLDFET